MMEAEEAPEPRFRPPKRRKVYRQRSAGSNGAGDSGGGEATAESAAAELPELSMAELLRLRKTRARRAGIEFGAAQKTNLGSSTELVAGRSVGVPDAEVAALAASRFAPQTGQISTDADKHMMEYIESEIARRREANERAGNQKHETVPAPEQHHQSTTTGVSKQPATLGRLHEIDLGSESNIWNKDVPNETNSCTRRPPRRNRKRRTSDDIKRDQLVDEVLRESRREVDLYDEPDQKHGDESGEAADDRMAEQFRREFMDAMHSRQRRRGAAAPEQKDKTERPKGPKLGGSRSARAAMREQMKK